MTADEVRAELADLYGLSSGPCTAPMTRPPGELRAALAELSRSRARSGATPSETALSVFSLKDAVYELVADAAEMVPEYLAFARMVDDLGLHTFEIYATARERIIADQAESMLELSTPVVSLWDGIIAVPLVGTLDSARTQLVMEKMLDALVATGAEHAVIDITGVPDGRHRGRPAPAEDRHGGPAARRRVHDLGHQAADRAHDRVPGHRVRRHRDQGDPPRTRWRTRSTKSGLRVGPA